MLLADAMSRPRTSAAIVATSPIRKLNDALGNVAQVMLRQFRAQPRSAQSAAEDQDKHKKRNGERTHRALSGNRVMRETIVQKNPRQKRALSGKRPARLEEPGPCGSSRAGNRWRPAQRESTELVICPVSLSLKLADVRPSTRRDAVADRSGLMHQRACRTNIDKSSKSIGTISGRPCAQRLPSFISSPSKITLPSTSALMIAKPCGAKRVPCSRSTNSSIVAQMPRTTQR